MPNRVPTQTLDTTTEEFRGTSRFQMIERLGSGGMGAVYRVFDREREIEVALKCMKLLDTDSITRFKQEFRALQDVHHHNLVRLGELFEDNGQWFFTMELISGEDFLSYVRPNATGKYCPPTEALASTLTSQCQQRATLETRKFAPGAVETDGDALGTASIETRPMGQLQLDRLRTVIAQLAEGLMTVHRAGRIHRDIKPSNILVEDTDRAVILDFGVIAEFEHQWDKTHLVGTAAFMAPEQAAGTRVGPPADWYALGVLLYLALTGRLPFSGIGELIRARKQVEDPIAPSEILDTIPEDLSTLCMRLLSRDSAKRADGHAVLAVVAPRKAIRSAHSQPSASVFVGRSEELSALEVAFETTRSGRGVTVYVRGESGVGKSTLVQTFLHRAKQRSPDLTVFRSRCYERESVPYKGLDGIVEALSLWLQKHEHEIASLLPIHVTLLAQVFPSLRRVKAISDASHRHRSAAPQQELRVLAFGALRQLMVHIGQRWPVIVAIDDLQWADADSWQLLAELMSAPNEPKILLIATERCFLETELRGRSQSDVVQPTTWTGDTRTIDVAGLSARDARVLARTLLRDPDALANIEQTIADSGGHPLLLTEMCRYAAIHATKQRSAVLNIDDVLRQRVDTLSKDERRLLNTICLAGAPITQGVAGRAAALNALELDACISRLRAEWFARTHGARATDCIEPYHDRVRAAVIGDIDPRVRTQHHRDLAVALESLGGSDAELLAIHWHGAGDGEKASHWAEQAGQQAAAAFAFDRAAKMYRMAIDVSEQSPGSLRNRAALWGQLAESLANGGRGKEAADAFLTAAQHSPLDAASEYQQRAAEVLLRSGHIDAGISAMQPFLRAHGIDMPKTTFRALASALARKLRLRLRRPSLGFRRRAESEVPRKLLAQMNLHRVVASGIFNVDRILGVYFHTRYLELALKAGEPYRVNCALGFEAVSIAAMYRDRKRSSQLLDRVMRYANETGNPYLEALYYNVHGSICCFFGEWRKSYEFCTKAQELLQNRCTDVSWEIDTAVFTRQWTLAFQGRLDAFSALVRSTAKQATDSGNLYLGVASRSGLPNIVWLMDDAPATARCETSEAIASWSQAGFHLQHMLDLYAQVHIDMYEGNSEKAVERLETLNPRIKKSGILRLQLNKILMLDLRARAFLGAGISGTTQSRYFFRKAQKEARRLYKEDAPWGQALAFLIQAQLAALNNEPDWKTSIQKAAESLDSLDMQLYAAAARCISSDNRATAATNAMAKLSGSVKQPLKFIGLFAPLACHTTDSSPSHHDHTCESDASLPPMRKATER